jgi:Domain of unknown function (DUF4160)
VESRTFGSMPRISQFYGITILMFFGDHDPPHFHARYAGHTAKYRLDGELLDGLLPRRANRLVREWAYLRSQELLVCWDRVLRHEDPGSIQPLE